MSCKCVDCFGLREWMEDKDLPTHGLAPAKGCTHTPLDQCDGTMTCSCERCEKARIALLTKRPAPRQPWEMAA